MDAGTKAHLIEFFISASFGVYFMLVGYRLVGPRPGQDERRDAWHERWGLLPKLLGPIVIFTSVLMLARGLSLGQR